MDRDLAIKALRPQIEIIENDTQSDFEQFQNQTLRQICKLQNNIILKFIDYYIFSKNKTFLQHDFNEKLKYIASLFSKDTPFKNVVIGHFTSKEFEFYSTNVSEINKRIIELTKTRFLSQF